LPSPIENALLVAERGRPVRAQRDEASCEVERHGRVGGREPDDDRGVAQLRSPARGLQEGSAS